MELTVHDNNKVVEVWITNAEKNDPAIQSKLKGLYATFKARKYTVAVFQSGSGDLYQSTRDLLAYNKRHCVEMAMQQPQPTGRTPRMDH